jgi:hypothetical protein
MRENVSLLIMTVIGLLLVVIGFEGSLGKCLACLLEPSLVVEKEQNG